MITNYDDLKSMLLDGAVNVKFTKVNGDERIMDCTQNLNMIPVDQYPQQSVLPESINDSIERVFDMNIGEWRSFHKNSVISFQESVLV